MVPAHEERFEDETEAVAEMGAHESQLLEDLARYLMERIYEISAATGFGILSVIEVWKALYKKNVHIEWNR